MRAAYAGGHGDGEANEEQPESRVNRIGGYVKFPQQVLQLLLLLLLLLLREGQQQHLPVVGNKYEEAHPFAERRQRPAETCP